MKVDKMSNRKRDSSSQSVVHEQHVLVVDDVAMDGFIASCVLRQEGYTVTWAKDGPTAIEAVEKTDFAIVLMDVRMPDMDGLEATRQIRKLRGAAGQVPIVALSAADLTDQKEFFFDAGMDGVMSKPFSSDALHAALSQVEPASLRTHRLILKVPSQNNIVNLNKVPHEIELPATLTDPVALKGSPQNNIVSLNRAPHATELPVTQTDLDPLYGQLERSRLAVAKALGDQLQTMDKASWSQLRYLCMIEKISFFDFVEEAKSQRPSVALAEAVRLHIIHYFRARSSKGDK